MAHQLHIVGKANRKVDALQKVSGQTLYAADLSLPRMLHCKILRSIHPHARIVAIDTGAARALPGVMAVITGQDLPNKFGILPVSQDEESLAVEKVRYVGDPIAAVAAVDEETAEAALKYIHVEYEVLPPVMSIEEGVQPLDGHEPIHDYADRDNIHKLVALEFGEVEAGFSEADLIQEDVFFYEGNTHLPLEEHAALARYEANGKLTVWSSTQCPHYVHKAMAGVLDLPPSRIRIIAPPTGGGFGGKTDPFNHEMIVAKLAMITGRPVKIVLTREEVFYAHRGRHPVLMRVKTGVKKDGSITAMHFQSFLDGGSYGSYGVASTYYTGALQTVTYHLPAYNLSNTVVPAENLLGLEGEGFKIAMSALDNGRYTVAAGAVGLMRACLEESVRYANQRVTFGQVIGKYQLVQQMIARMVQRIELAQLYIHKVGWLKNQGLRNTQETSLAKWFATESAWATASDAVQIFGTYGYSDEYNVERYLRNSKSAVIYEGTSQIHELMQGTYALGYREDSPLRCELPAYDPDQWQTEV